MCVIIRFNIDFPEIVWHLGRQIQDFPAGLLQISLQSVKYNDAVTGEAAAPLIGGDSASIIDSISI